MFDVRPVWTGRLIRLRAVEPADAERFNDDQWDSEAQRTGYEINFPRSMERTKRWVTDESLSDGPRPFEFRFAIETLFDGELVGSMNTHGASARNGHFEYGVAIFQAHRGKGYASEAIRLVLRYYFKELRFNKANATVYAFNEASLALHRKFGFVEEGCIRQNLYTNGEYHDEHWFGMTAAEFFARYP